MKNEFTQTERPIPTDPNLIPLTENLDLSQSGGKAVSLSRLIRFDIPVPPGFVVQHSVFNDFLSRNALKEKIDPLLKNCNPENTAELQKTAEEIRNLILAAPLSELVEKSLRQFSSPLLEQGRVIVRSSAIGEDSLAASFAGQLDSFPDIETMPELINALKLCWLSYWSDRSLFYQYSRNVALDGMGVVIQRQIEPRVSGVLFTVEPGQKQAGERMLAEFVYGHGEQLVSGKVTPGSFTISKKTKEWQILSEPEQQGDIGANRKELFETGWPLQLAETGILLEQRLGVPQDIEWTLDHNGMLWLVQSRPITAPFANVKSKPKIVWSNANINENFPDPVCPLLYSFAAPGYTHYFSGVAKAFGISEKRLEAMRGPLNGIIGIHGARMYYNLSNIHAVLRMAPFGEQLADYFNHFVGAEEKPETEGERFSKPGRTRLSQSAELLRIALKTAWQYLLIKKRISRFENRADCYARQSHPEKLPNKSLTGLRQDLSAFLDIRFNRWTDAALADGAAMICYGILKHLLNRAFPETDQAALHNTLLKGLPDVVSSKPVIELWELSRLAAANQQLMALLLDFPAGKALEEISRNPDYAEFHTALNRYLEDFGFRCSGELMLTVASFQEQPALLLDILKTYLQLEGASPVDVLQRQNRERLLETDRVFKHLAEKRLFAPLTWLVRRSLIGLFLYWTQGAIALRERARFKQALLYSRLRGVALAIGRKLTESGYFQTPEDVFFLTTSELDRLISGQEMFPFIVSDLISLRRKEHDRLGHMVLPDAFEMENGVYWEHDQPSIHSAGKKNTSLLQGVGACGGKIIAPAAVLDSVIQSDRLKKGDILVTRQTDPGWGPVFFLISGLVIERGGMLSHGAILAREFGIPAVVAVPGAMQKIPQGAKLQVDGDAGNIRILD